MTTLATRTETRPVVIDGEVVRAEQSNPYRLHAVASALAMGGTGLGAGWSVVHDYRHADLAAGVFFLAILAFVLVMSRFNSFDQDC